MPSVVITLETHLFGLEEARATLAGVDYRLDHMHEVVEGIVGDIHRQTLAAFASHGAAIGDLWEPLDPKTVANKMHEDVPFPDWPLVRTGMMMDSATSSTGPYSANYIGEHMALMMLPWERGGWNIPALQQLGVPWRLVTRHKGHSHEVTYWWHLPSRPFWKVTDHLADEGADRIERWIWGPGVH